MCSLTWLRREGGYELFFNRDESRRRLPALPPRVHERGGVAFLAALDADAGGTWLGVNAFGLSVGLLNGTPEGAEPGDPISRGLLVLDLLDAADSGEVGRRLDGLDLSRRKAFQLIALDPGEPLLSARWDGRRLELERHSDDEPLLTSSSLDPLGADRNRRRLLERLVAEGGTLGEELLLAFHASHEPEASALSPCMHREDAQTVSFTRTRVAAGRIELGYSPAAPCRRARVDWSSLERLPVADRALRARTPAGSPGS